MIRVRDLWKIYHHGKNEVPALRGVDLDVSPGEFVAVVGPSGSGKSTLLNLLGTLDTPTRGEIELVGHRLDKLDESGRTQMRRGVIGFAFQFFNLMPMLTARENVALPMLLAGVPRKEANRKAEEILTRVGLGHRFDHRPEELSGGEMQRVAVSRALSQNPRLILADEPTGNLDTRSGQEVLAMLRGAVRDQDRCMLMVTHDPKVAAFADRIVTITDGKIVSDEKQSHALSDRAASS